MDFGVKIIERNGNTEVYADEGMTLTNGDAYTKMLYLGCVDKVENWREITDEEAEALSDEVEQEDDI